MCLNVCTTEPSLTALGLILLPTWIMHRRHFEDDRFIDVKICIRRVGARSLPITNGATGQQSQQPKGWRLKTQKYVYIVLSRFESSAGYLKQLSAQHHAHMVMLGANSKAPRTVPPAASPTTNTLFPKTMDVRDRSVF
jgi:hypothetical protein